MSTKTVRLVPAADTAANWTAANPVLDLGEAGYETDTGQKKVGDGSTAWTSLAYSASGASITVDDSPTDGDNTDAISSNWAYDHANGADPHSTAYIAKTNTSAFTPTADYHPATKKYVDDNAGGGTGDVTGPGTSTENNVPQWDATNNTLKDGLGVVTTLGSPGADTNLPTEAAVRAAISSAGGGDVSGPASSTDGNFAIFSGTSGKTLTDTGVSASDFEAAGAVSTHAGAADPHTVYMLESEMGTVVTYNVPAAGDAAVGEIVLGSDSRLTDARTPSSHNNTAHSETYITTAGVTYEALNGNSDVGTGAAQVAAGDHNHTGTYEPADATILKEADVSSTPTDAATTTPISSDWAHDHVNAADPHTGYMLESATQTTLTDSDTNYPTSGAVVDYVAAQVPAASTTAAGKIEIATTTETGTGTSTALAVTPDALRKTGAVLKVGTATSGACDLETGTAFDITVSGATTISVSNAPSGMDAAFLIRMTNGGSSTVTWPSGITWPGGSAPTLTASGLDHIYLLRKSAGGFTGSYDLDVKTA